MKAFVKSFENSVSDPSHMLYMTTGAVYGHTVSKTFSENDKVSDVNGLSSVKKHYAAAKIISEQIFRQLKKTIAIYQLLDAILLWDLNCR